MDAAAVRADRLDALDLERFEQMLASPPFRLYVARLEAALEQSRLDCERKPDTAEIHRAQGQASAFRTALALPEIVRKEIERGVSRRV